MSNKSFEGKRPWFADSKFATNRAIARSPAWDEKAMIDRAKLITDLALRLWPLPEGLGGSPPAEASDVSAGPLGPPEDVH